MILSGRVGSTLTPSPSPKGRGGPSPAQDALGARPVSSVLLLCSLFAVTAFAGSASVPATTPSPVVATVNGEQLSLRDFERYLGTVHDSAGTDQRSNFDLDRLTFRMVNDTLLGQEARALGLDEEGAIADQIAAYRARRLTGALEREEIAERSRPTEDEIRRTFEEQYRELTLQVVTAYQRHEAEELLAELRGRSPGGETRHADMETVAREHSVDPYAARGGQVSVAAIDLQREVAELASALVPGEIGGPVRTDLGWSVIRLVEIKPADPERFPKVVGTLRQLVRHRKSQVLRAALAQTARQRHTVKVDQELAASVKAERLPDARLVPRLYSSRLSPSGETAGPPPAELADPGSVVARIAVAGGGQLTITVADFRRALLARWSGVRNAEAALASAPIILDKMIEERLLLAEAQARGYGEHPEMRAAIRALETSLLVPRYLEEVVAPGVEVSRSEMEAYYQAHRAELTRPPRIHLRQITVAEEQEAWRIAGLLRAGADLGWLARQHSTDRFSGQGGERGWVDPGATGFGERLLAAAAGDVLDPVGVRGNYVVLKVTARQEQGIFTFDEVSGNVKNAVFSRKMRAAIERLMDTLRDRAEIEIDRELLAGVRLGGTITEKPENEPDGHGH